MLSAGKVLFLEFFSICRLIKGPQDIPGSKNLLTLCMLGYAFCSIILVYLSEPFDKAILAAVLEVGLVMVFTQAALQIRGKPSRWAQTVTALFGTGIIISLLALPIYLLIGVGGVNDVSAGTSQGIDRGLGLMLLAALACWNIAIMAHILRHALEITFMAGVILGITYIWIIFSFTAVIMPIEAT